MNIELVRKLNPVVEPLLHLKEPERLWIIGCLLGPTGADAYDDRFALGLKAGKTATNLWEEFTIKNPDGFSVVGSENDDEDENDWGS